MKQASRIWIVVALCNFLFAALIGTLLRFAFVTEVRWIEYKAFEEAHEYTALLGWTALGLFALLAAAFLPEERRIQKLFHTIFWSIETLVLANALNFILTGNKMISSFLLSAISLLIFLFALFFHKHVVPAKLALPSFKLAGIGLIFLAVSFLGVYLVPFILQTSGSSKLMYFYLAVQFFLHFQYNGWFVFAVLALLLRLMEANGIVFSRRLRLAAYLLGFGTLFSFSLSVYWAEQEYYLLLLIAAIGGIMQMAASVMLWKNKRVDFIRFIGGLDRRFRYLLIFSLCCFIGKLVMQTIIIVPEIAELAFTIRNYVIAFLHLVFLGFLSFFIIGFAIERKLILPEKFGNLGLASMLAGFVAMELLLFVQGTMLWMGFGFMKFYYELIFAFTVFLPLGLILLLASLRMSDKTLSEESLIVS